MRFCLTDEQTSLRDAVRELLAAQCPPSLLRDPTPKAVGALWEHLDELGLFAVAVPESRGGLGLTVGDLVPMLIELGYAAAPLPAAETAMLAGLLEEPLGDLRIAVARDADLVPYGAFADRVLLGDALFTVEGAQPLSSVDGARALARVKLGEGVPVAPEARLRYDLAIAAQQIGLSRRMLDMTVEYVAQRKQFGAPVGSFQAVKHQLADALLAVEFAEPAVLAAGWSLSYRADTAVRDVAMAAILATEAAQLVAKTAIQCHGAIGYTVEYDLNLYAKRAWALAAECDLDAHLAELASSLGLEG